jgi:hypothetical protein
LFTARAIAPAIATIRRPDHGKITAAQIAEAKADYDAMRSAS